MLTRQEATQSRFAYPEITEIGNDGQSEENHPNLYYNNHNTGDAELMPTLERVVDYPPQLKSQQMICVNIIGLLLCFASLFYVAGFISAGFSTKVGISSTSGCPQFHW
jgi:hypothetical protein